MYKTTLSFLLACGILPAQTVTTQTTSAGDASNPQQNVTFVTSGLAMPGAAGETIGVIAHEFSFNSGKPVVGEPYSADQVSEHVQTLADGNRIVNTTTTRMYRDSQGRTRTETTLPTLAGGPPAPVMITIHDPVAGVTYMLNSANKTAQKLAMKSLEISKEKGAAPLPPLPPLPLGGGAGPMLITTTSVLPKPDVKTEDLGRQTIDGVVVTGTRRTETIPAGAIGNEGPIETKSERWFSADLQLVVKSVHTDPRIGQTTETVSDLNRSEPDPSLFQVPGDYTITDAKNPAAQTLVVRQRP